jgi:hypothetical protein
MTDVRIPKFSNESEESDWWYENRASIGNVLISAVRRGDLGEGSVARRQRKLRELQIRSARSVRREVVQAFAATSLRPQLVHKFLGKEIGEFTITYRVSPGAQISVAVLSARCAKLAICA